MKTRFNVTLTNLEYSEMAYIRHVLRTLDLPDTKLKIVQKLTGDNQV